MKKKKEEKKNKRCENEDENRQQYNQLVVDNTHAHALCADEEVSSVEYEWIGYIFANAHYQKQCQPKKNNTNCDDWRDTKFEKKNTRTRWRKTNKREDQSRNKWNNKFCVASKWFQYEHWLTSQRMLNEGVRWILFKCIIFFLYEQFLRRQPHRKGVPVNKKIDELPPLWLWRYLYSFPIFFFCFSQMQTVTLYADSVDCLRVWILNNTYPNAAYYPISSATAFDGNFCLSAIAR